MNKVVIIGCGNVGMSCAYALLLKSANINELVLVDINQDKTIGEAMDLNHALSFGNKGLKIIAGDFSSCENADIVIISAGKNQTPGETRTDLLQKNYQVFQSIINAINKTNFNGIYLIATNPVDTMALITKKLANFPCEKVIGTGTTLDTARLRYILGEKLQINSANIHGYVLGEHGDSEFISWDNVTVGANNILNMLPPKTLEQIEVSVRDSANQIISKKGNTSYGIGMCVLQIVNAILQNENRILTISSYDEQLDIYYSMPTILNRQGIKQKLPLPLSITDNKKLEFSVQEMINNRKQIFGK